jgi:hypothetical protein
MTFGAVHQRAETAEVGAAVLDTVLTTMALLGLTIWSALTCLYGPFLLLVASDGCSPEDTAPICATDELGVVALLPGACAAYALLLAFASCFGGRAARGVVIPIAYLIAAAGTAWALHLLSGTP